MKKVLFLSAVSYVGGAEKVLLMTANSIITEGYQPLLITQDKGPLTEDFCRIGGKVFIIKLPAWRKFKNIIRRFKTIRYIADIVRRENINFIYANSYRLNPYALAIAYKCKINSIVHIHDVVKKKHIRNFHLNKSPYLLAVSNFVRKSLGFLKGKVFIIYPAVEVSRFSNPLKGKIKKEFNIREKDLIITMIAHFAEHKGHRLFIDFASKLKNKIEDCMFIIVGDCLYGGPISLSSLKEFSRSRNVEDKMIFTGNRDDVSEILSDTDIFILPSEIESFGLVVIEAMAARVPVIVNVKSGGSTEIIKNGWDGVLVDCSDIDALVRVVVNFIKDKRSQDEMVSRAYKKVLKNFDTSIFKRNILGIFEEIERQLDKK